MSFWNRPNSPVRALTGLGWSVIAALLILGTIVLSILRHHPKQEGRVVREEPPTPLVISSGTIGVGGSLDKSLNRARLTPQETTAIIRAIKPLLPPQASKPTDSYEVHKSTDGRFVKLVYWPNAFDSFNVIRSSDGTLLTSTSHVPLTETLVGAHGQIKVSLWEAMTEQQVPPEMIYRFAELFSWRFDFLTEPRQGDSYKIVWRRHSGNGAIRDDEIVCAFYHSREKGDLYALPLAGEYYDQEGDSLRGEFLRAPLAYRRISSRFTNSRYHPILRYYRPHHGIDYSAARGTPVVSIGEGTVIAKGYEGGLGNEIRIRHAGSYVSIYGHLMGYARGVRIGAHVKQGQVIGYVGSTGLSTGPHLHFGFERGGQLINFLSLRMKTNRRQVPAPERSRFETIKQDAMALLNQLTPISKTLQVLTTKS